MSRIPRLVAGAVLAVAAVAPAAAQVASLEAMLALDLDGIVIATPSALHAEQAIRALDAGMAVFCQKPLGRDAAETAAVVEAAQRADRLLGVDLSYRFTRGMAAIAAVVAGITAWISTWLLMRYFRSHDSWALTPFALYCLAVGGGALGLLRFG